MAQPAIIIYSFNLLLHNLSNRQQAPPELPTIYKVIALQEQGQRAVVLQNVLLDHVAIERLALVQVPHFLWTKCSRT